MGRMNKKELILDEKLNTKSNQFIEEINSEMIYKAEYNSDLIDLEWINELEFACPYIDNIISVPKVALISEEDVVKIEKAKKISVASVKDLSKHTHYIDKIDKKTNEVQPSKLLIERKEETYNTYENRFIYTLLDLLNRFLAKRIDSIENFSLKNNKTLEYSGTTTAGNEKLKVEVKLTATEIPDNKGSDDFEDEISLIQAKIKRIKNYVISWRYSEMVTSLDKARVSFVSVPIKRTNIILKNPNFQIAMKLWTFLNTYDNKEKGGSKANMDTQGDNILKSLLDDSFLMNYYVLDSIPGSKKNQKEKLGKYAVIMINQQLKRIISLLLNSGIKITDEDILSMVAAEIQNERQKTIVGSEDVKKKFKSALEEYLEKTRNFF